MYTILILTILLYVHNSASWLHKGKQKLTVGRADQPLCSILKVSTTNSTGESLCCQGHSLKVSSSPYPCRLATSAQRSPQAEDSSHTEFWSNEEGARVIPPSTTVTASAVTWAADVDESESCMLRPKCKGLVTDAAPEDEAPSSLPVSLIPRTV